MKNILLLLSFLCLCLSVSCVPQTSRDASNGALNIAPQFSVIAHVERVEGNIISLGVPKPAVLPVNAKLALRLARGIIDSSYFLENREITIMGKRCVVKRFSGNTLLVETLADDHGFTAGDRTEISLDRKIIAVKDFEVISGSNKEVARYVQEDVTTALVHSGQFHVVEREKLDVVLEEIKLGQSGMVTLETIKKAGRLLGADLILTGSFMPTGEKWNANLRLINTESGRIISAINVTGPLHELKTEAYRNIENIKGDFEDPAGDMDGWATGKHKGKRTGQGGFQKVYFDDSDGANGSSRCIAMRFKFGMEKTTGKADRSIQARIRNLLKRDVSQFSGIRFFMRGSHDVTVVFKIADSQKGTVSGEGWLRIFSVADVWTEIKIPFKSLSLQRGLAKRAGTNQILELNRLERLDWIVGRQLNDISNEGIIWLDEVSFY